VRSLKLILAMAVALSQIAPGVAKPVPLAQALQSLLKQAASPYADIPGVYATVRSSGPDWSWTGAAGSRGAVTGQRNPSFRVASVSKMFVAVALLRLSEQAQISLDDPIARWLPSETTAMLVKGGYDVQAIKVRHLLAHTSGLTNDHAEYYREVARNPGKHWTSDEYIDFAMTHSVPAAVPGTSYTYSDLGYLLVGMIVEKAADEPLAQAVRRLDRFARLGLNSTYFEGLEQPIRPIQRARQRIDLGGDLDRTDVTDWNPTYDPYGASGVISTTRDLARFVQGLFEGEVFERQSTLSLAMAPTDVNKGNQMIPATTLIFEQFNAGGVVCWGKSGWYSVFVGYCPAIRSAFALTTTDATSSGWAASQDAMKTLGALLGKR
jgi:D-alanyl-D-alanine carboxypeptidase